MGPSLGDILSRKDIHIRITITKSFYLKTQHMTKIELEIIIKYWV